MTAKVIDGKAFAAKVRAEVAAHVARLKEENGLTPGLAVVLVGEDPASQVYVRNKHASTIEVGMSSFEHRLPAETSEETLLALIDQLNADASVHGILVQLPLPAHLNSELVINRIHPPKDVGGFHISDVGPLGTGPKSMVPGTPSGCLMLPSLPAGTPNKTPGSRARPKAPSRPTIGAPQASTPVLQNAPMPPAPPAPRRPPPPPPPAPNPPPAPAAQTHRKGTPGPPEKAPPKATPRPRRRSLTRGPARPPRPPRARGASRFRATRRNWPRRRSRPRRAPRRTRFRDRPP